MLLRLLGTATLINGLNRKLTKAQRKAIRAKQAKDGSGLVKKTVKGDGKVQISGTAALKWSAHYPSEMCSEVVRLARDPLNEA